MKNNRQTTVQDQHRPDSYRTTARIVGVLYLAGFVVGIGGEMLIQPILGAPNRLATMSANSMMVAIGALLWLMTVVGDAAHGVLLFPILKRYGERIALGYLAARIVDAIFIAVMVLLILIQIPLGSQYLNAAAPDSFYLQALSTVYVAASQYAYQIGMSALGLSGLLLCSTLYRARFVPRILAVWGLVGYAIIFGGMLLDILGFNVGLIPVIPGGLWEVFIGVWLIAKGFNASPISSERITSATTPSMTAPDVSSATI